MLYPPKKHQNTHPHTHTHPHPHTHTYTHTHQGRQLFFSFVFTFFFTLAGRGAVLRKSPNVCTKLGDIRRCTRDDARMLTLTSRET